MPEQDLIVRHHEVYPGAWVNLTGLLRTLMSYEIRAKKALEFMWLAHPWLPLWASVPPKPRPRAEGSVLLTENARDSVNGLVALHSGELRHWAFEVVWWTVSPGPLPDSSVRKLPPEFLNPPPRGAPETS